MSPIGRVFIVLNLVLSAAFLGWAANALGTTGDYKKELEAEKKAHAADVAGKEAELQKLQVELNGATEQQGKFREQRDQLQASLDQKTTQYDEQKRANDTMQGNLTKIQATLGEYNNTFTQLTQQKDAALERAHEAERARDAAVQAKDAAEMAKRDSDDKANAAMTQIGDLEKERTSLQDKVSTLETRMATVVEKTGVDLSSIEAAPQIDAYVLEVNRELKLVVLNKGKKDDVKKGYTFSIYRGAQYKGQIRIQDVQDGMCSGTIVAEKAAITKGDSATTSL